MSDTDEPVVAIRPRIQRLLLSDEYFEFEELVLVEAAFAQVTRRGRGIRQVQIAITPTKFVIATDELGGDDTDSLFYVDDVDADSAADALEMVSIVPIECVNLSVFSRRRHKLKARFCNGKVYYFELSERGTLGAASAASVWHQWEERVEFLCPNLNSSSSETSVANSSSTLSTLERRRSLRQLAAAGTGQVQVSWFARGSQLDGCSQRADSSVWMTSDENEVAAVRPRPLAARRAPPPVLAVRPATTTTGTGTGTGSTDSSTVTCSTCSSSQSSSGSSTTATTRPSEPSRLAVPRLPLGDLASGASGDADDTGRPAGPAAVAAAAAADRRGSQTLLINRFGTGVEEKCSLSLYLTSDTALQLSSADRERLGAFTGVADDALRLWELSALARKRRHTRHSVLTPLAERHVGWTLLTPGSRAMARVRRTASETRLGGVAVRQRTCGQTRDAQFHLPLRRGDLCASVSLADLSGALAGCRETVPAGSRLLFWRPEQADRPDTDRHVYARRLQLLAEYRAAHLRAKNADLWRAKENKSKVARSLSKLSARARQSTSQAIKKTCRQMFGSLSSTPRPGQTRRDGGESAVRRAASESRVQSGQQQQQQQGRRAASLSPQQRAPPRPDDEQERPAAFCRFVTPRRPATADPPLEPDSVSQDRFSEVSTAITDDALWRVANLPPDSISEVLSLEQSLLDSTSGGTGPAGRTDRATSDATSAALSGATTLRRVREIDSTVLAHQLTLLDGEMLRRVTPQQLTGLLVRRDPRLQESLVAVMLMFHRLVCLVATNVLLEDTYRDRAKVITKLVTVAERCYHLRNFHSCKAVLSGLQCVPVYRLRRTWDYMKTKHDRKYRSFKSLSKLFADTRLPHFQRVFADVAAADEPFVPFFGDIINTALGHNCAPRAAWPAAAAAAAAGGPLGSPVLSWVQRHFDPPPEEAAARRRVLQRKYVTRWRAAVRRRRFCARRFRPSWLNSTGGSGGVNWPGEAPARRRLRSRLAADCRVLTGATAHAATIGALWRRWRLGVDGYRLEERQLVRQYLLLARHYTMETALGLSLDREPPDGSSCTLCSNTGIASDSSAEQTEQL